MKDELAPLVVIPVMVAIALSFLVICEKLCQPASPVTQSVWSIESEIYDGDKLTGLIYRNKDPRDVVGTGGQVIITSNNPDTLELLRGDIE